MAKNTPIQWCDDTVNPTAGCDGCELWNKKHKSCYAGKITRMYAGTGSYPDSFDHVETRSRNRCEPSWAKARHVVDRSWR